MSEGSGTDPKTSGVFDLANETDYILKKKIYIREKLFLNNFSKTPNYENNFFFK